MKLPLRSRVKREVLTFALPLLALFAVLVADTVAAEDSFALPTLQAERTLPGEGALRRYEGYAKGWPKRRGAWSRQVDADQNAVVFLGDSITQGWGDDFKGKFPGMKTANRGIGGDTTRGMLIRLEEDVLALKPRAIVMLMGTNDIEVGIEPAAIGRNFEKILAAIEERSPEVPIILCRMFPSTADKNRPSETIQAVNALYEDAVRGNPRVTVLDTWTLFADKAGDADPRWFRDLLHLNSDGYDKWASALHPLFATLGFSETEPDPFVPEAGFRSLFNGKDLSGWGARITPPPPEWAAKRNVVFVEHKEDVSFDGKKQSDDGRYEAINGRLVVKTSFAGRHIQQLWTTEEFGYDFVLKLEFRATPKADSGVFIRKKQFQVRDYVLAGPYHDLEKYRPQDWNALVFTVKGGVASVTCNGVLITDDFVVPATGPIGLEGDGGQMEYRRIRLKRLAAK